MITGILIYIIIGMWLAADVIRYAPSNLEAPAWFIALTTTLLWPMYILVAIWFIFKRRKRDV